tara:strand:+ start:7029 stop:7814 length:786 start_codon:yes stop_codon:yes gene_type:complete
MDIVIQGKVFPNTYETAKCYTTLDFIDKVIISTWDDETLESDNENVVVVKSPVPYTPPMNLNLQLVSVKEGLKHVTSEYTMKFRSDQMVMKSSMKMLKRFVDKKGFDCDIKYTDGSGPKGKIYAVGMGSHFPYHPQDHIFWGHTEDIKSLYSCPLYKEGEPITPTWEGGFENETVRIPCYFGSHYFAKFDSEVYEHIENYKDFLLDTSPSRYRAMQISEELRDKIFGVFPRIKMWWEKYNTGYKYDLYEPQGEYYYDEEWE